MASLPSISVPFTDSQGRINPIWHEFLRSFVASSVAGTVASSVTAPQIKANNGLIGGGPITADIPLRVGQGDGIAVNADDVSVSISGATYRIGKLDDEVLVSNPSENNAIKRTRLRDIVGLNAPGGASGSVQYNNSGTFTGDTGLTYDGAGTLSLSSSIKVGSSGIILNKGSGVNTIFFDGTSGNARIQSTGGGGYSFLTGVAGTSQLVLSISSTSASINIGYSNGRNIILDDISMSFSGNIPLCRNTSSTYSASTSQSQGFGSLTSDYNIISTVANDNDTVTLPTAILGRQCLVYNNGAKILQIFPASGANLGKGTNASITLLPGAYYTWVATSTTNWYQIDGETRLTNASGITASTTQTQGQQPLTKDVNEISVVANINDTVTLPSATSYSRSIVIINNGANILQIFPASGNNLGLGLNTSTVLAAGASVRYTNYNNVNWKAI